jgi:hypothetical protein
MTWKLLGRSPDDSEDAYMHVVALENGALLCLNVYIPVEDHDGCAALEVLVRDADGGTVFDRYSDAVPRTAALAMAGLST